MSRTDDRSGMPRVDLVAEREAVAADSESTFAVALTVTPPMGSGERQRPPLNLAVVIDRSGSMSGNKLSYARKAARYLVRQLLPSDRASIIAFDSAVHVLVPSSHPTDPQQWIEAINRLTPGSSTALHAGWSTGADSVAAHHREGALNRVILLTDGQANLGETRIEALAQDAERMARRGITTTTMGIGSNFNEDLLIAMYRAGRGNGWYIGNPEQLPDFFQSELTGLLSAFGSEVELEVRALVPWVRVQDLLNDFERTPAGGYRLPDLEAAKSLHVLLEVQADAGPVSEPGPVLEFRLSWKPAPGTEKPRRRGKKRADFVELPGENRPAITCQLILGHVEEAALSALAVREEVVERQLLLKGARDRVAATQLMDRGDYGTAAHLLQGTYQAMAASTARTGRHTSEAQRELAQLQGISTDLASGDTNQARKKSAYQARYMQESRVVDPDQS